MVARRPDSSRPPAGTHQCPGPGCTILVPSRQLMCPQHWYRVPRALQRAVWTTWADGAGAGTRAHAQACIAAVRAVGG